MSKLITALEEAGIEPNMVQVGLGQDRGFVRIRADGVIEFHLVHKPDEELYPGEEDFVEFKPDVDDVNLFRILADHLSEKYDEAVEEKPPVRAEKNPVEPERSPIDEGMRSWLNK